MMNIKPVDKNVVGYQRFACEVTEILEKIIPYLKEAWVVDYAADMNDAEQIFKDFLNDQEENEGSFSADGKKIVIEFDNGQTIMFWNSEWGGVDALEDGSLCKTKNPSLPLR